MSIYLSSGYLDQRKIEEMADKNNISFIVEIGGRQVGKTYGTLQRMIEKGTPFILMRRTMTEMDFICNDINNPFAKFKKNISVKKSDHYTATITLTKEGDDPRFLGTVMALSTVAKIRGFDGSIYENVVFDEFIPENHIVKIRDEGDAFINAAISISGNRELEGAKPLRFWLLANANTLKSPILQSLNISEKVEDMSVKGQEVSILPERGIMIILPKSDEIIARRKETSIFKAVGTASKVSRMALNNEFAYNDFSDIVKQNLKGYTPLFAYADIIIYRGSHGCHACDTVRGGVKERYVDTDQDRAIIRRKYGQSLKSLYLNKKLSFSNQRIKGAILDLIL